VVAPELDCFVITSVGSDVAGFAVNRADEFLHFGTALGSWGTGLAQQAHDDVMRHLEVSGHPSAWLRVFEGNTRARRFYERLGWQPTGATSRTSFPPFPLLVAYWRPVVEA
jgi:RimJ/RimL family protein N-acetyltransferase